VTIVIDVANVMGSRPDGWWRDRAGAAVRLHDEVARLAGSGHLVLPAAGEPAAHEAPASQPGTSAGQTSTGQTSTGEPVTPGFVLVLEGAAKAAARRISPPAQDEENAATSDVAPGEVRTVLARGSGDDTIVAVARDLPGRRYVVTADRELRRRCVAAGAGILGPGWLLGQLRRPAVPPDGPS
jgi:8-oxo-dGTP diphosphatase